MMNLLCTFPGKYGDLLWALPTVRALARRLKTAVDLVVAQPFNSICPLIASQPYIGRCWGDPDWQVLDTAPISPQKPPRAPDYWKDYDCVLHLGYRSWPLPDVCRHTLETANYETEKIVSGPAGGPYLLWPIPEEELDLTTPWITLPPDALPFPRIDIAFGWSDEYFELKYGISQLLGCLRERQRKWDGCDFVLAGPWGNRTFQYCPGPRSRWISETGIVASTWPMQAAVFRAARVSVGCNSALHVLALAVGTPVVMVEPQEMRHNQVFFPLGTDGSRGVTLVTGNDGKPTFDVRHVADVIDRVLLTR